MVHNTHVLNLLEFFLRVYEIPLIVRENKFIELLDDFPLTFRRIPLETILNGKSFTL